MSEFYIVEESKVFLNQTKWFEKRLITTLPEKNQEALLGHLEEKFTDLDKEVTILLGDYIKAEDKVKFAGKINRMKSYLSTAKAIGDFNKLFQPLDDAELAIKNIVDQNVAERKEIIVQAEAILETTQDWKAKTDKLAELSKQMRALPLVPDPSVEDLKNKLDKIRDEFFAKKSSHFEDQEKVVLDNLAHKIEICEKAEALSKSTEWKATTEAYNKLNEEWKVIGHIPRHRSEELWLRFNQAKDVFFNAKKENFGNIKEQQEEALVIKLALIEKAEAIKDSRDWKKTSDEYNVLLEEWKKSGRVSNERNDEVWNKFNEARGHFFTAKETYYSSIKLNLDDNYNKKMAIVTRTEELANSELSDWDGATSEILEMNEEWKKIGRVPKEYGDEPWERFLKAKQTFFDKKDAERAKRRSEGGKALEEKSNRNKGYFNKLKRELDLEVEVLEDFKYRLKNLPPGVRSFETAERYESIIADAEKKVSFLKKKIEDVKANLDKDEKEMRFISRPFIKKGEQTGEASGTDVPRTERPVYEKRKTDFNKPRTPQKTEPSKGILAFALEKAGLETSKEIETQKVEKEIKRKEKVEPVASVEATTTVPENNATETIAVATEHVEAQAETLPQETVISEVNTTEALPTESLPTNKDEQVSETKIDEVATAPMQKENEAVAENETLATKVEEQPANIVVNEVVDNKPTLEDTPSNTNDGLEVINENPTELN